MLGRFKPVEFQPYGRRRARWVVPRWLALLLAGIAVGAGGVVLVQERYLPPRLSAEESAELRGSVEQIEAERQRLHSDLADSRRQLEIAIADKKSLADETAPSRDTIEKLRKDVASLLAALPPDPRPGAIAVRAARFAVDGGSLAYDVLLSRERPGGEPLAGVMQVVIAAESARGQEKSVTLEPVSFSVGSFENLRGKLRLPDGFKPQKATINVLDRVDGKQLGMRIMYVR